MHSRVYGLGHTYLRWRGRPAHGKRFGPKPAEHLMVELACPVCEEPFATGDYTTLVMLGPGADATAQERCAGGRYYHAVALECHAACAWGTVEEPVDEDEP